MRLHPLLTLLALVAACSRPAQPERHYYDEHVQPIFDHFCVGNTSPCHSVDKETGVVLGNLDLSSFESVQKRRDVLRNYGPYPQPLLLMKATPEESIFIPYGQKLIPSEVRHVGGKPILASSDAFFDLKRWMENGATRDGLPPVTKPGSGAGPCAKDIPTADRPAVDRLSDAYQSFVNRVGPFLVSSCAFATCHSSSQADFFLTCGDSDEAVDFNFLRAAAFIAPKPSAPEGSELLLRPLAQRGGGTSHTGGTFFGSRDDRVWKELRDFAVQVQALPPAETKLSPGEAFFGEHVMPVLVRRGCAFETCHSPNGFNDFRLRPGVVGFLSPVSLHRNYEAALLEFMALDTPDARQSRLVKKNLFLERTSAGQEVFAPSAGIVHRGGAQFEGASLETTMGCPPFDAATASDFCKVTEWHRIERQDHAAVVSALTAGSTVPLAFVARPPDPDSLVEFDTFRGGADLKLADARVGANGRIESVGNVRSGLGACAGLGGRTDLDVRGPEWSPDGARVVFAVRAGEAGGLDLWLLDVAAGSCRRLTSDDGKTVGSVKVHNFDPVFAPDGSLVFASTRAGTVTLKRLLPNADLYRVGPSLVFEGVERMTFLSNSELGPAFMQNGQLTFTAEKATPDFYQLSGRRINWDLTDYHPLLAQRAQSADTFGMMAPSVDYQQATEIREGLDRDFLFVLSDIDAKGGGGALGVFNRSIGPFEAGRADKTFLKALHIIDAAATGKAGTAGVYRSPFPLPDGAILASYAANVANPAADVPRYDLVAVETGGSRRMLVAGADKSLVEATLGTKRSSRLLFQNHPQLVFGGHGGEGTEAVVHFPDLPMLATLLDANLRRGRNVDAFAAAASLAVYEITAPTSVPAASALEGSERVYWPRMLVGSAPLAPDGSLKVTMPSQRPLILELRDSAGKPLFTMREEHQLGPGEVISPGVSRTLFNGVCAGCHGSVTGKEPDVAVLPDALTGATMSMSRDAAPKSLR